MLSLQIYVPLSTSFFSLLLSINPRPSLPAAVDQSMPLTLSISLPLSFYAPFLFFRKQVLTITQHTTMLDGNGAIFLRTQSHTHTITPTITHNHNTHLSGDPLTLRVRLFGL
jgi:hypothetical protein